MKKKNYITPSTRTVVVKLNDSVLHDGIGFGNHSWVAEDPLGKQTDFFMEDDDSYNLPDLWGDEEEEDF